MKVEEIRGFGVEDLRQQVKDLQDQIFRLRIQKAMGGLDVPHKVRNVRRDLARVLTILKEKEQ